MRKLVLVIWVLFAFVAVARGTDDTKSTALISESNQIYDRINLYNNTVVPKINTMLGTYTINESDVQVNHLTTKQKGAMLKEMAQFIEKIGDEIGNRDFEQHLTDAGYVSVEEAYADVPNRFAGQTATAIQTNMTKASETLTVLDGLIDDQTLVSLLQKIITIKNKVAEVSPQLDRR